jgi:hypothetical protein
MTKKKKKKKKKDKAQNKEGEEGNRNQHTIQVSSKINLNFIALL